MRCDRTMKRSQPNLWPEGYPEVAERRDETVGIRSGQGKRAEPFCGTENSARLPREVPVPKKETSSSVSRKTKAAPARPAQHGKAKPAAKAAPAKTVAVKAAVSVGKKAESARKPAGKGAAPVRTAPAKAAGSPAPARKPAPAAKAAPPAAGKSARGAVSKSVAKAPAPVKPVARPAAKLAAPRPTPAKAAPAKAVPVKAVPAKVSVAKAPPAKVAAKPVPEEPAATLPKPRPANDLALKIIHMIAEEMAVEEAELTPNASFREDLNLDEIDVAELLVRAEELFGLKQEFDDEEWENCQTVGDFIVLVERRVSETHRRGAASSTSGKKTARS